MCQPRKWFWGLFPLAALWAVALYVLTPQIESELTHRVHTALAKDMPWARTAIEGRDIVIEGAAPSDDAKHKAMRTAVETDGVRLASSDPSLMAEAKSYRFEAKRDGGKVVLGGVVANEINRAGLIDAARKVAGDGGEVVDEMKDGRIVPVGAMAMATAAVAQLAHLKSGAVTVSSDGKLSVTGTATDAAALAALNSSMKSLPQPLQAGAMQVAASGTAPAPATVAAATPAPSAPAPAVAPAVPAAPKAPALPTERPFTWSGTRSGDQLTLSGFAPSEAARAQVVAAARSTLGGGGVTDQMKVAAGLPAGIDFAAATGFAVTQLAQMKSGSAKLTDGSLKLDGEAIDAAAYRAVVAATSGTSPGGIKLEAATVSPPKVANYVWSARRDDKTLTLAGYYPDEGTRTAMLQGVTQRFGALKLDDRTSIASGAPNGFSAALGMGLDQLSRLNTGEAAIAGGKLVISGVAPSDGVAADLKTALSKLVGGIPAESKVTVATPAPTPVPTVKAPATPPVTAKVEPAAPPVAPAPVAKGDAGGDAKKPVSGTAVATATPTPPSSPSAAQAVGTPQAPAAAASAPAPAAGKPVTGGSASSPAAPPSSTASGTSATAGTVPTPPAVPATTPQAAAPAAATTPPKSAAVTAPVQVPAAVPAPTPAATPAPATTAPASAAATKPAVPAPAATTAPATGNAAVAAAAGAASTAAPAQPAAKPPAGVTAPATVGAPLASVDGCIADLTAAAKAGRIRFQSSRADIRTWSRPAIDKAVAALKRCPALRIEVAGHTDATGSAAFNERLSKSRADAVVAVLAKSGIARDRLTAAGYASARPIATNATAAGKAQNRRIEFNVIR